MAPSAALQSRIQQFEAMESRSSEIRVPPRKSSMNYPPSSQHVNPLEEPISPTASTLSTMKPAITYIPRQSRSQSASPSPPSLGLKTSLIDLNDWIVEGESTSGSSQTAVQNGVYPNGNHATPKPKRTGAPPLPPRIPSNGSSKHKTANGSPSNLHSLLKPSSSGPDSLTVDHTYPPVLKTPTASSARQGHGHVHALSSSSFHSVSLSSDAESLDSGTPGSVSKHVATFPMDVANPKGTHSPETDFLDDSFSFEAISASAASSPSMSSTHDWEEAVVSGSYTPVPPKLPERSKSRSPIPASTSTSSPSPALAAKSPSPPRLHDLASPPRRAAPPPPPSRQRPASNRTSLTSTTSNSTSDRSSIFSAGTVTTAHTSLSSHGHGIASSQAYNRLARPTPVPPAARRRYEALFLTSAKAQRQAEKTMLSPNTAIPSTPTGKQRKGWRGLSVDLITDPDHPLAGNRDKGKDPAGDADEDAKLHGQAVKLIWSKSKLDKGKLRDIWNECSSPGEKTLDRDAFIRGMWRIDEELRRSQSARDSLARNRHRPGVSVAKRTPEPSLLH